MKAFRKKFPDLDMVYFGDRANCPYGDRPSEEIRDLTAAGIKRLFDQGATIVVIACNTGAAHAIRYLQNEVYPAGCGKQVLSVTVPGAEKAAESGCTKIGVLATKATVASGVYGERIRLANPNAHVEEVAAPGLVNLIEAGSHDLVTMREILDMHLRKFSPDIETLVLGCTHYPIIRKEISDAWGRIHGKAIPIIDPADEAAERFETYLKRHPEFRMTFGGKEERFWS